MLAIKTEQHFIDRYIEEGDLTVEARDGLAASNLSPGALMQLYMDDSTAHQTFITWLNEHYPKDDGEQTQGIRLPEVPDLVVDFQKTYWQGEPWDGTVDDTYLRSVGRVAVHQPQ